MRQLNKFFISSVAVLGLSAVLFVSLAPTASALYSSAVVDANLERGIQSAVDWETCRRTLDPGAGMRAEINDKCSYADDTWLSGRGTPKSVLPVDVAADSTSVALQINSVTFIKGPLVVRDNMGSLAAIINDDSRWVTNPGDANDRQPNAVGASGQKPARVETFTKIKSLTVVDGPGNISQNAVDDAFTISRDGNSRYWFTSPKNVVYTNSAGIKDGDVVRVQMSFKRMTAYWKSSTHIETICPLPSGTNYSNFASRVNYPVYNNVEACAVDYAYLNITFRVPFSYELTPSIENIDDTPSPLVVSQDSVTPVRGRIDNRGPTLTHDTIEYQLSRTVFAKGVTPNKAAGFSDESVEYCDWGQISNKRNCGVIARDRNQTFRVGTTRLSDANGEVRALEIGTQVCYTLSVKRYSHVDGAGERWRHSVMKCTIVGKYPAVHVLGGDLRVGRPMVGGVEGPGRVTTGNTSRTTGVFGSWSEYAIVPRGAVTNMGSGSGYVGGMPPGSNNLCLVSLLTFNNARGAPCTSSTTIGAYSSNVLIPDIARRFSTVTSTNLTAASVNIASENRKGVYSTTRAAITVHGSTIANGRWVVLYVPNTTVTITGNIDYDTARISDASQIPQVIIIARNIIIQNNVTKIDAWLIANGTGANGRINTCGAGGGVTETSPVNTNVCNAKLTVNGPVAANHLFLRRTHGSDSESGNAGDPAEVFNLRPDAYLWATEYSASSGRLPTVTTTELPPRF